MICLTDRAGLARPSRSWPSRSCRRRRGPCWPRSAFVVELRRPSFLARAWISHGSQTLRKSMNSGGLPPRQPGHEEHRQQALHVGLGGEGHRGLGAVVVEGGVEEALHHVGDRQRNAAPVAAPFELAHEAAADGVEVGQQVADDQVHRQRLVEPLAVGVVVQVQAVADVACRSSRAGP